MTHQRLGLFDTRPTRQEIRLSLAMIGLLFGGLVIVFPLRDTPLGESTPVIPLIDAFMLFSELIIATLLYAQANVFRSRALTVLASGYVFAALVLIPHALTFPGAFATNGLLGAGINTTAWLAIFRRFSFPIAVIAYALLKTADSLPPSDPKKPPARVIEALVGAILLAALGTLLTTVGHDFLPAIFRNSRDTVHTSLVIVNSVTILFTITAMTLLFRNDKSVLDLWLLVALSGWIFQSLLNLTLHTRFTLGWYGLNGLTLASSVIIMLALIAETSWLYSRLAVSAAARDRERDARLMSMDAVTAAISHEVGQPLTAVSLNASAAVRWLTRSRPDVKKALTALRAVNDAGQRTFDVIKSMRATFSKERGQMTEFNLNDLVHETASLLDRELATTKVSLKFSLEESLPPIEADRVQMQRLLVNLFTNAIDSLREIQTRPRIISIRSAHLHGKGVQLTISDTGTGIAPENLEHIFDAFFTTKVTGTGLGLPLCRIIAEDHGGRLWASQSEPLGAQFHLRLPPGGAIAVSAEDTDRLLTNLEGSLRLLRQTQSDDVSDVITDLQQIVNEVRGSMRRADR